LGDSAATERVLVVGGGIAGLAAARALRLRDRDVLVLERRPEGGEGGLAINLPGNAIRALGRLGLSEALAGRGAPVRRREYRSDRDRMIFTVDEEGFWGADATPRCLRRSDLLELLGSAELPSRLRYGREVVSVAYPGDGVELELADGGRETGGFLIGADGIRSRVRRSFVGEAATGAALLAKASWRFMAPNPGVDAWTIWVGKDAMILLIPVDRGEVYGWAAATGKHLSDVSSDRLADVFARFPTRPRQALSHALGTPSALFQSPLEDVRIPSWGRPNAVLIGDAAHATAPVWAQGAAMAFEDALVLGDILTDGRPWSEVHAEYERRRRPRVDHVQAMTDKMSRAANLPAALRTALMPFVGPRSYAATYGPLRAPPV
jgi:2-polyprenyl-6-methoxyphenol hydroxylase-like FAD-dependent oxidoreductase